VTLSFKVGTMPARKYLEDLSNSRQRAQSAHVIVDKVSHGSRPFRVRLTEVRAHTGGGDIYFVEQY